MADDPEIENIRVGYPESDYIGIPHPPLRAFRDYCLSVKPRNDYADRGDFDFNRLQAWLGNMMIAEYLPETKDFRYRLYGTAVSDKTSFDLTGTLVSERPPNIGGFIARHYIDAVESRRLVYTEHTRIYPRFIRDWHRVICPVVDTGRVQIVTCIYSVNTKERPA
jgi:hypothetical protein